MSIRDGVKAGDITLEYVFCPRLYDISDVDLGLLMRCLDSADTPRPDILVRTSGEVRLSDFMLMQASYGCPLYFISVLWPEFGLSHFMQCVWHYHIHYDMIHNERDALDHRYAYVRRNAVTVTFRKITSVS